jgi:hypothetical protein
VQEIKSKGASARQQSGNMVRWDDDLEQRKLLPLRASSGSCLQCPAIAKRFGTANHQHSPCSIGNGWRRVRNLTLILGYEEAIQFLQKSGHWQALEV